MRSMTVGELQEFSPVDPVSRPYRKQIVPPMMSRKPSQSILPRPVIDSFLMVRLRLKNRNAKAIPSKGRLM